MILYLGSSSLVKLYVEEPFSDLVADWVAVSEIVATCRVAYTEVMSALNIRLRNGDLSREDYERALKGLAEDWPRIAKIDFDELEAGNLIGKYGLSRFAAIHLSATKVILNESHRLQGSEGVDNDHSGKTLFFSSTDMELCKAAKAEGLRVLSMT